MRREVYVTSRMGDMALTAGLALLAAWLLVHLLGCGATLPGNVAGRETARAAVLTTTAALKAADEECAAVVLRTRDAALGERCDRAYTATRLSLVTVAITVDAWDEAATRSSVTCACVDAAAALVAMVQDVRARGGRELAIVEDAATLARMLGTCPRKDGGT